MKTCSKCRESKPLDAFHKHAGRPDGRQPYCKGCQRSQCRSNGSADRYRESLALDPAKAAHARSLATDRASRRRCREAQVERAPYSRADVFARWGGRCAYCDDVATEIDHVIAISLGGADAPHNVVPACGTCNRSKGAKTLADWASEF